MVILSAEAYVFLNYEMEVAIFSFCPKQPWNMLFGLYLL